MSMNYNYALYYPSIEFQDYEWLCGAALIWDRIYRIIPAGYKPEDCEEIRILSESGEIGIPVHPDEYVKEVGEEFLHKLENKQWNAAALEIDVPEAYARLHKDKVDVVLRNMIIAKGKAASYQDWLYVPTEFASLYMTYLARSVADRNHLQMISDSMAAWSASTYFGYDGQVEDYPHEDYTHQLAALVVRDFIPENLLDLEPKAILDFREKYRDERIRFLNAVREAAKQLSECEDEQIIKDIVDDIKKDIQSSLKDYKKSMAVLNITAGWTGLKSLSFPVLTKAVAEIIGQEITSFRLTVVSAIGIAIGLISGFSNLAENKKKLTKESDFSYLLHLERGWKGSSKDKGDYNYCLCRTLEEFIND